MQLETNNSRQVVLVFENLENVKNLPIKGYAFITKDPCKRLTRFMCYQHYFLRLQKKQHQNIHSKEAHKKEGKERCY